MAKASAPAVQSRTEPVNFGGNQAAAILSAWQGVYHLFGFRADTIEVIDGGIVITGLTSWSQYDPAVIAEDISKRDRRIELTTHYGYLSGAVPADFVSAQEITQFMVQFWRGSTAGEGASRTPAYLRQAAKEYKAERNMGSKRGPKRKTIHLNKLNEVDVDLFKSLDDSEIDSLLATLTAAKAANADAGVPTA
jgi:hypothetical protein